MTLKRGYDLPHRERRPGTIPVVSSSGPSGFHDEAKVEPLGVVTGRYGTIGQVFVIEEPFWPLNTALYVEDFRGNDPRYCAELLRSINFRAYDGKSGVPGVNRNDLHTAEIVVPPLGEQAAIAGIANSLDAKITSNRRVAARAEEFAAALFRSWFIDFDPVRAKAAGETPVGVPDDALDLFPDAFVDSEIGPIPEGWAESELRGMCAFRYGKALPARARAAGAVPVIGSSGVVGSHDVPLTSGETVVVGRKGHAGSVHYFREPVFPIDTTFTAEPLQSGTEAFLFQALKFAGFDRLVADSAVPGLNRDAALSAKVINPPASLVSNYCATVAPLFALVDSVRQGSQKLAELRDTLLPELISGRLRVPAEDEAEELVR